jgi:hypothetical protein
MMASAGAMRPSDGGADVAGARLVDGLTAGGRSRSRRSGACDDGARSNSRLGVRCTTCDSKGVAGPFSASYRSARTPAVRGIKAARPGCSSTIRLTNHADRRICRVDEPPQLTRIWLQTWSPTSATRCTCQAVVPTKHLTFKKFEAIRSASQLSRHLLHRSGRDRVPTSFSCLGGANPCHLLESKIETGLPQPLGCQALLLLPGADRQ